MSQMNNGPESNGSGRGAKSSTGTPAGLAVLMLAVFVVLGVGLLHELDDAPTEGANSVEVLSEQTEKNDDELPTRAETSDTTATTNTTIRARTPSEVKVLVANGVGVPGAAAKVASHLQPVGYQLLKPGNTETTQTASAIQYAVGYQSEALAVATTLGIQSTSVQALATPAPVSDLQGANVLVIVGNDLAAGTTSTTTAGPLTSNTTVR